MNKNAGWYLYNNIPGAHQKWTLAVSAVSRSDADWYIRCNHRGATFAGVFGLSEKIDANCGAQTEKAHEEFLTNWSREAARIF